MTDFHAGTLVGQIAGNDNFLICTDSLGTLDLQHRVVGNLEIAFSIRSVEIFPLVPSNGALQLVNWKCILFNGMLFWVNGVGVFPWNLRWRLSLLWCCDIRPQPSPRNKLSRAVDTTYFCRRFCFIITYKRDELTDWQTSSQRDERRWDNLSTLIRFQRFANGPKRL